MPMITSLITLVAVAAGGAEPLTLATMPGPGYTRSLSYDEEGRLTGISKIQNGVTTNLYQYGYGFDGNRRWRKDLANNVWDWYPCGVACCAGELVTLRSTNGGTSWSTLETKLNRNGAQILDGASILETSISGAANVIQTLERAVTDSHGVIRAGSYGMRLQSAKYNIRNDDSLEIHANKLALVVPGKAGLSPWQVARSSYPPGRGSGPKELCKTICSTLVCGGLKGPAKKACMVPCNATCNDLSPGIDPVIGVIKPCLRSDSAESCYTCCQKGCTLTYRPGQVRDICVNKCQYACETYPNFPETPVFLQ